jgi:excisionase family DNA binding protein
VEKLSQKEKQHRKEQQRRARIRAAARLSHAAFTINEWIAITGLSKATTYRMMEDGRLQFAQFGRTRRIPATEQERLGLVTA